MSKIETDNFEITPEPFAPAQVITVCCDLLALHANEAGVGLERVPGGELPEIVADKRALNQILLNLLSNAIRFTDRGGRVTIGARAEAGNIVFVVEDNGIGINEEDLARVGEPSFQARASYDRRHGGTGLGFSIVKGLVRLHGGEVTIHSRIGVGTRVSVRLPLDCERTPRAKRAFGQGPTDITRYLSAPSQNNAAAQSSNSTVTREAALPPEQHSSEEKRLNVATTKREVPRVRRASFAPLFRLGLALGTGGAPPGRFTGDTWRCYSELVIVVNALFLQSHGHLAPFVANPAPKPQTFENRLVFPVVAAPRATAGAGTTPQTVPHPQYSIDLAELISSSIPPPSRVVAVQRVLFGVPGDGQIRPSGIVDGRREWRLENSRVTIIA